MLVFLCLFVFEITNNTVHEVIMQEIKTIENSGTGDVLGLGEGKIELVALLLGLLSGFTFTAP